jgi:hypothetical protein
MTKKIVIGIIVAAIVIILIIVGINSFHKNPPETGSSAGTSTTTPTAPPPAAAGGITAVTPPQSAYDIALARAKQWEPDALADMVTLNDGTGGAWTFLFVSQKKKGTGFQVVVSGQAVTNASEIPFSGGGAPLPSTMISPDAAIATAHGVPGYGSIGVVSLSMIYNGMAKQWYWGVKMANGVTLTINAIQ